MRRNFIKSQVNPQDLYDTLSFIKDKFKSEYAKRIELNLSYTWEKCQSPDCMHKMPQDLLLNITKGKTILFKLCPPCHFIEFFKLKNKGITK